MGIADDEHWMARALALAERAEQAGEVPVGALLVRDGAVLGEGWNQMLGASDPTAHAEIVALRAAARRDANYRIPGSTLYVTIEPCTMCAGALVHARVERLVYGATEPRAGAVDSSAQVLQNPGLNHRVEVISGVLATQAAAQLKAFFAARRQATSASREAGPALEQP